VRPLTLITITATLAAGVLAGCSDRSVQLVDDPDYEAVNVRAGRGAPAGVGDQITASYTVTRPDGRVIIDLTGSKSHTWTIGDQTVLLGVDEVVRGMRPGGVRRVTLPPALHFGEQGYADGLVPPDTDLTFEITLLSVR